MNRVLICYRGTWMEWSTILDVPATTGMDREEMLQHLLDRGVAQSEAIIAMDWAEQHETSMRDVRSPEWTVSLEGLVQGNRAGINNEEMPLEELISKYLINRETLF